VKTVIPRINYKKRFTYELKTVNNPFLTTLADSITKLKR